MCEDKMNRDGFAGTSMEDPSTKRNLLETMRNKASALRDEADRLDELASTVHVLPNAVVETIGPYLHHAVLDNSLVAVPKEGMLGDMLRAATKRRY